MSDGTPDAPPRHRRGRTVAPELPREPSARDLRREADRDRAMRGRRRIAWALVAAMAIITASVVGSVWWLERGQTPADDPAPVLPDDGGLSALVILRHDDTDIAYALAAGHPDADDTTVLFPRALMTIVPGYGTWDLAFASGVGDPDLPAVTLTNLLGARIDGTVRIPAEVIADTVDGAVVDLPAPLIVRADDGDLVVTAAAGPAPRDAATMLLLLTEQGTDNQLSFTVRQGLVWRAFLERADADLVATVLGGADGDRAVAETVLGAMVGVPSVTVTAAPVEPVDTLGSGQERYQLQVGDAEALVTTRMPWLALVDGERVRVEILNGTGRVGVTAPVAAQLVRGGYRVVRTDNADTLDYRETRVVGHTVENQAVAFAVRELLGFGEIRVEQQQPSLVVDVTVIVGRDAP